MRSLLTVIFIAAFLDLARGYLNVTYLGCYKDSGLRRLLPLSFRTLPTSNTPITCAILCRSEGYFYSGVESSSQCFCGNEEPSKELEVGMTECDAPCSGDKNKFCGGSRRLQLYSTGLCPGTTCALWIWEEIGCYQDSDNVRLLSSSVRYLPINNGPTICAQICAIEDFIYAGVEFGVQCFCGHQKPADNLKAKNSECNIGCPGEKDKFCGGQRRLQIFRNYHGSLLPQDSLGCYADSPKRLFSSSMRILPNNSPYICNSLCKAEGYSYSGVELGDQCFCGDDLPGVDLKVNDTECNIGCSGDRDRFCGGYWRLLIFKT